MSKIDFKKTLQSLYHAPRHFVLVDVPEMQFLMIDGEGDPNRAQEYQHALQALYALAYPLKFRSKKDLGMDYVVPPLEGLWWADEVGFFTDLRDKARWKWRMMIMTPEWISAEIFAAALQDARRNKAEVPLEKARLERYHEGLSVQILHIGSYDEEAPTLARLHSEFLPENGYIENGLHHEIYLSDPRRVSPEKLKTILRQPVKTR